MFGYRTQLFRLSRSSNKNDSTNNAEYPGEKKIWENPTRDYKWETKRRKSQLATSPHKSHLACNNICIGQTKRSYFRPSAAAVEPERKITSLKSWKLTKKSPESESGWVRDIRGSCCTDKKLIIGVIKKAISEVVNLDCPCQWSLSPCPCPCPCLCLWGDNYFN